MPINLQMDTMSPRHICSEAMYIAPALKPVYNGMTGSRVPSQAAARRQRQDARVLPSILLESTTELTLEGEQGKHVLYAISLLLSEIPQIRYSTSHTLQIRKFKFREVVSFA